jgi:hypothetical protein
VLARLLERARPQTYVTGPFPVGAYDAAVAGGDSEESPLTSEPMSYSLRIDPKPSRPSRQPCQHAWQWARRCGAVRHPGHGSQTVSILESSEWRRPPTPGAAGFGRTSIGPSCPKMVTWW